MVALDPSEEAVISAASESCQLLLCHHPLILTPLKCIDLSEPSGMTIAMAIKSGVAIAALHTDLDAASWGVSQVLAERLGLRGVEPLEPAADVGCGMGRVGLLPAPMDVEGLARLVKERLGIGFVRCVSGAAGEILKVAVCGGSGGSMAGAALASGAQALVTGDVRYHQARDFAGRLAIVDCGHFAGEVPVLSALAAEVERLLPGLARVSVFEGERDPFRPY
jgi:dinuclear metal center YbgI/SA1388 family protein